MKEAVKNMSVKKRTISMILCALCTVAVVMTGTLTWQATSRAINSFSGSKGDYLATLEKKEKDLEGNQTTTKVANAEFYLYRIANEDPEEVEQIGGRYVTDADGKIEVSGLVAGSYYFLETSVPYGYGYDKEDDGTTDKKRYNFDIHTESVDASGNVKVEAFNIKKNSELEILKRIENHDGSQITDEQKELIFTFAITFSDGKTYPYVISDGETKGEERTLEDGKFTLKHGETAIFKGVPINVVYNVTEVVEEDAKYSVSSENHTGNIKRDGNKATFVNTFGEDKSGSLTISKTVTGTTQSADLDTMFTFTVTLGEDPDTIYPYNLYGESGKIGDGEIKSDNTIRLKHGQWVVFPDLEIDLDYQVNENVVAGFIPQVTEKKGEIIEGGVRADFINTKEPVEEEKFGNLIVTKTVEITEGTNLVDEEGEPIVDPMEQEFHFTIRVGTDIYTCDLKHGETYRVDNIPVGTDYEVIEDDYYEEGYITSGTNTNATIVEGDNHARVLNTFSNPPDEETYGKLRLEKHVVGGDSDKEFTFHVKIGNEASQEIKLKNGEYYETEEFLVGTHYQIYEENYYSDGYITTSVNAMGSIIEGTKIAAYTNTYQEITNEYGQLEVSKTVSDEGDKEKDFTFKVTFSDGKNYPYEFTDRAGNTATYSTDNGEFTLQHGEKATFKDIPVGVVYEVIEEATEGYLQGLLRQTGTIVKDTLIKAAYQNHKQPEENEVGLLDIKKIATGEGADLEKEFDFVLSVEGEEPFEFTLKHGEERRLAYPVGLAYEVSEKEYIGEGYILKSIQKGSGTITHEIIEVIAENAYIGPVLIKLTGTKTWNVPAGITLPEEITIQLKNGNQVVKESTATADTNWKYTFEDVPKYDEEGEEIVYTVEEKAIAGFIASTNGLDLTNTYIEPATLTSPVVEKRIRIMKGDTYADATFTFILEGGEDTPMPEGTNRTKKEVQFNNEGSINFGDIKYTLPGTYVYTIKEVIGSAKGYTYDTTSYTYTVVVEEVGGELVATGEITLDEDTFEKAVFINRYTPEDDDKTNVTVRKVWADVPVDKTHPTSIKVQLFKNGKAEGEAATLSVENEWAHTWSDLEKDVNWSVDEVGIPENFVRVITKTGETGFTITNTYQEIVTPTPTPIGEPTPTPTGEPTPTSTGELTPTPTEMPGVTITPKPTKTPTRGGGTSGGGTYSTGGKVATPKTDDPMARNLWFAILILSAIGLRVVFVLSEKENKKRLNKK